MGLDRVLKEVGKLLAATVRGATDGCYRVGGDEFAVILPGASTGEEFKGRLVDQHFRTTLSVGMVGLKPGETSERFLQRADTVMYAVKKDRGSKDKAGRGISP